MVHRDAIQECKNLLEGGKDTYHTSVIFSGELRPSFELASLTIERRSLEEFKMVAKLGWSSGQKAMHEMCTVKWKHLTYKSVQSFEYVLLIFKTIPFRET